MKAYTIYKLCTNCGYAFYIGCTSRSLDVRKRDHLYSVNRSALRITSNNNSKNMVIQSLKYQFQIIEIETVYGIDNAKIAEGKWIAYYLSKGVDLTNMAAIKKYSPHIRMKQDLFNADTSRIAKVIGCTRKDVEMTLNNTIRDFDLKKKILNYTNYIISQRKKLIA